MTVVIKKKEVVKDAPTAGRSGIASPYFDLAASIAVAEAVYQKGGGTASPDQLAHWLGYKSTASGTYLTRVSAANKHFGLIETTGDQVNVTERARRILAPVMIEDVISAKVDAFLAVPLFARVFEQFKGNQLPPEVGLKNLFRSQYQILPDRVAQAVRVFLNSAEQAGFFSTTGDRSRLIKPTISASTPIAVHPTSALPEPKAEAEATLQYKTPFGGNGGGGDGMDGVHTAILGLLRELPPQGYWPEPKKKRFLDAFKATIDFIYPPEDSQ